MHHSDFTKWCCVLTYFGIAFGPAIVAPLLSLRALQSGSYLQKQWSQKQAFQRPVSEVVTGVTIALSLAVWCIPLFDINLLDTVFFGWTDIAKSLRLIGALLGVCVIVTLLYWSIIRWYRSMCLLVLDKGARTYRTLDISGIKLKVRTGSWNEIAGIYVKYVNAKGTKIYFVRLRWNSPLKLLSSLGGFGKRDKAEEFAARMSRELGLPLVAPPYREV